MPFWQRFIIAGTVFVGVSLVARIVDWRLTKRSLPPEAVTRYRVLRRSITTVILVVGFCSALLVIPQIRAVAGGLLASSAVLGVIIGLASQRTLSNFIAGLLIALSQPLRLGDRIRIDDDEGIVEDIGLTYTFIRAQDDARIVVPNEKLASDTIRNSTIRSREKIAQITVQVPLSADLGAVLARLEEVAAGERDAHVFLSALEGSATITMQARAGDADAALRLERDLRLRAHERLRSEGIYA